MADFYTGRQRGTWYPIILETPNHIVIEGVPHDKATLNPLFLQSLFAGNINNYAKILTNKYWFKGYYGAQMIGDPSSTKNDGGQGIAKNVWPSKYDPNEFFIHMPMANNYIYRVRTDNLLIKNIAGDSTIYTESYNGRQTNAYIFNETPDRLDCNIEGDGSGRNGNYYFDNNHSFSIYKSSFTYSGIVGFGEYGGLLPQVIFEDTSYVYFSYSGPANRSQWNDQAPQVNGCRIRIYAWHKATTGVTTLFDYYGDTYQLLNGPSVGYSKSTSPSIKHVYTAQATTTAGFFIIKHLWVDTLAPLTNKGLDTCVINTTGTPFTPGDFTGITGNRYTLLMRNTVVTDNTGKKYLCLTLTNTANWNSSGTSEPLTNFKTWVFRIEDNNTTLTPVQILQHDDRMYDMIPLNDSHTRTMWIFPNYLAFAVWNNSTSKYEIVNKIAVTPRSVGVDELDRVWVCDYNNNVQLMTPFVPSRVDIKYELEEYNYQGTDIPTYINVSAFDAFGDRIIANVTLTIEGGNCTFADGTSKKTITTIGKANGDSDTQVDIVILNAGYFRLLANTEV